STLIEALQKQQVAHKIVNHTTLLKEPEVILNKELFQFLGLRPAGEVNDYLQLSNRAGSGKHNTERRREALLAQIQIDRKNIYPLVKTELEHIHRHPVLKQFISKQ